MPQMWGMNRLPQGGDIGMSFNISAVAIPDKGSYWLRRARVPACFLAEPVAAAVADGDDALLLDVLIEDTRIARIVPSTDTPTEAPVVDLAGRQVWPTLVDMHAHLDKAHVIPRTNPDGTFTGGRVGTVQDRSFWSYEDLYRRMSFGVRCAYVHGVAAIRTHLDSHEGLAERSWAVFRDVRTEWTGRIALQAVALVPLDAFRGDYGVKLANLVAESGGVLGGVTRAAGKDHVGTLADTDALLDTILGLAAERGLDVDLHVDESDDLEAFSLPRVATAVLRNRFRNRVVCDHCVNLALQPDDVARHTIGLCVEAGLSIVTLPTPMVYLQDRRSGRTPRWRGVTLLHELRSAGVPVAVAGDNCRDTWYAYGDHDMVDTFQQAVRIFHLDHPLAGTPAVVGPVPATMIRAEPLGRIATGSPARLILFAARTLNELLCRPQADRIILDRGRRVRDRLPDYEELDARSSA
jgi:cytosine/creatinine deaminase